MKIHKEIRRLLVNYRTILEVVLTDDVYKNLLMSYLGNDTHHLPIERRMRSDLRYLKQILKA